MEESESKSELNNRLFQASTAIRRLEGEFESHRSLDIFQTIIGYLHEIINLTNDLDGRIASAIKEVIALLNDDNPKAEKVANAAIFASAFGRGQQYVSLATKFTT